VLRTLTRGITRQLGRGLRRGTTRAAAAGRDPSQLLLELESAPRNADELLARLRALGLSRIARCRLTRNRSVMVSFRGGELRVHEGYLAAPLDVQQAVVRFVQGRTRAERRLARERIVVYSVPARAGRVRRERTHPDDEPLAAKLAEWHARLNGEHFDGQLSAAPVRVSRRMRSRLGHYSAAAGGEPAEIAISWRHLRRHAWAEVLDTLLHEMVHQWQDETGRPIDHGRDFRLRARQAGIDGAARRAVARR
jgi:hypothetical protein